MASMICVWMPMSQIIYQDKIFAIIRVEPDCRNNPLQFLQKFPERTMLQIQFNPNPAQKHLENRSRKLFGQFSFQWFLFHNYTRHSDG